LQTLTDRDKILQAYVSRTQISCKDFGSQGQRGAKWRWKRWDFL